VAASVVGGGGRAGAAAKFPTRRTFNDGRPSDRGAGYASWLPIRAQRSNLTQDGPAQCAITE